MCGIAGFIDSTLADAEVVCAAMTSALAHRGPDDVGYWFQRDVGLALGHRRLSVVDLSPAGHQPMRSPGGRFEIVFNGEIYNHREIRKELERAGAGAVWRGHADTETLLAAIEAWGLERALQRCRGMFAFALWDRQHRILSLARDRAGEKPLYYGRAGHAFLFGSEVKALQAHPAFNGDVDRGSLALFLRHSYVPEPLSIFMGIRQLPPGTILEVNEAGSYDQPRPYWSFETLTKSHLTKQFAGSDRDAIDALEHILGDAVGAQMVADVPLGAFLSGGVDSSLIVALMQRQSSRPVRTFTIGFSEPEYDESAYARAVARHLGTDHSEIIVTPTESMAVIPRLATIYDEPFADSSQIPTFLVAQLARQHVTVSLSGDAGDELFGGYNRYTWAARLWGARRLLGPARGFVARSIRAVPPESWARLLSLVNHRMPRHWRASQMSDKVRKFADLLECSQEELYRTLVSHWTTAGLVIGAAESHSPLAEIMGRTDARSFEERMMCWDFMTYLPGDILVKVDRAAMAVALETRVPMLDHNVIEFAWSLPLALRVRRGEGKWLLKQLLNRYVPRALTDRPKTGFGIPIDAWLRGPLRDWAETLLDESRLRHDAFLQPAPIRQRWLEHTTGRRNWGYWLWDILMFQSWWDEQLRGRTQVRSSAALPACNVG